MRKFYIFYLMTGLMFLIACKEDSPNPSTSNNKDIEQTFPIVYSAEVTPGKVPFPHHDPTISQDDYEQLIYDLFVINNYGLYQCGDTRSECYFHDAWDIILPNGTPIFAVEAGTVRAEIGGNQYYRTLIIEDADEEGYAWMYTHINDFAVRPGELVEKGQYLGRVNFLGLEHIHFGRAKLLPDQDWNDFGGMVNIYPDDYFEFYDSQPPIIKTPFHFFENNTDNLFEHGEVDTVSGAVDIVVSMRDPGEYTGDWMDFGYIGERLCVKRIHYKIKKDGVVLVDRPSFDFSKITFRHEPNINSAKTLTVYKPHFVLDAQGGNSYSFFTHYILTNARDSLVGQVHLEDGDLAWDTDALGEDGALLFPEGLYEIEVAAYDSKENETIVTDQVYVKH